MTTIILDEKPLEFYGLYLLKGHSHPSTPKITNKTVKVPNKPGSYYLRTEVESRAFNYPVGLYKTSQKEVQHYLRELNKLLFNQYGQAREIKLRFGYEPEKYYKVKFDGSIMPERAFEYTEFQLPLTAYDPFAYAPADYYDPVFVPSYDTSTEYDSGVEYVNQTSTPFNNIRQYAGIFNYSHYATPFSFVIEGYVKNPRITNLTSGKSARLNVTVEADERLYFDSKLMTTWKVRGAEDKYFWLTPYQMMKHPAEWDKINKYNDMSGDFLELVSGKNSILFEGENPNAYVNFNWEHRFL